MKFGNIYLLLFAILLLIPGCGNEPVFTEMSTNRLKIVLKGTMESEGAGYLDTFSTPDRNGASVEDSINSNDSVDDVQAPSEDVYPSKLMLDIAEIRLGKQKISNYRQTFEIPLDETHPFFNGTGIELKTDDPGDGTYGAVKIYFRKMIFNSAKIFKSTGNGFIYKKDLSVIFHEETKKGFNFGGVMLNSYWDGLRIEADEIIRTYPMRIPIIGGLKYDRKNDETVLEIRLVIKNFIKKYEYDYYNDGVYEVIHYYAPSDWLRDVRAGEADIGRNLHTVARAYVPGKTASSVTVSAASGSYVIAIPESEDISDYYLTDNGKTIRDDVVGDFPQPPSYPGSYIEAVLEYYLKYEKYKNDWNTEQDSIEVEVASGCTGLFDKYEWYWDRYEGQVKGFGFGLKIPPYVGLSNGTVVFSNMAPGTYKFYQVDAPSYGELFLEGDFNGGTPTLIGGASVTVGAHSTVTVP